MSMKLNSGVESSSQIQRHFSLPTPLPTASVWCCSS